MCIRDSAVGNHLAEFLVLEVVGIDLDRLAFRSIITAGVLEFSNQLLLLRVDRDYWLIGCLELPCLGVDVLELCVAVRMVAPCLLYTSRCV